ncbi:hypothetical protein [Leptospira kanakyensis]|uniref:hypothetical protein n=1 Tax=Leptospira kanakyensis TaxID=2484968 RepID=UPI00223CE6D1|nr:hypothetical protein [Leptospira kanakyensis]MCW7483313.1 hypothetical protein [Leptospira kanakyensis]
MQILTKENASSNFNKALQKIVGNERGKVPRLLSQLIEKIFAYRGDAKGVTHASLEGSKIQENEAEFILSCSATIITYLISVAAENEENIPF